MIRAKVVGIFSEPLTIQDCYDHLRLDPIDSDGRLDDAYILTLITTAREYCENWTGLSLALKDYEIRLTAFPDTIELPHPPFVALLDGIVISDAISDNAIDEGLYTIDDYSDEFVVIEPLTTWPALEEGNTVRIRFRAGYGDESEAAAPLPGPIRSAVLLIVGHLYANREATTERAMVNLPLGVNSLLRPYRTRLGMA